MNLFDCRTLNWNRHDRLNFQNELLSYLEMATVRNGSIIYTTTLNIMIIIVERCSFLLLSVRFHGFNSCLLLPPFFYNVVKACLNIFMTFNILHTHTFYCYLLWKELIYIKALRLYTYTAPVAIKSYITTNHSKSVTYKRLSFKIKTVFLYIKWFRLYETRQKKIRKLPQ